MLQTAPESQILHLAFELASKKWLLGFSDGCPQIRKVEIKARDLAALLEEIARAKRKFHLPENCRVVSCYEAGRDGFWLHRWLVTQGIGNRVLDSASLETNRRSRRAKTDRIDVEKMVRMSVRVANGEQNVWREVNVPEAEVEDMRGLNREAGELTGDITMYANRIKGHLAAHGVVCAIGKTFDRQLPKLRGPGGLTLGQSMQARLLREWQRMMAAAAQLKLVEAQQRALMQQARQAPEEVEKEFGPAVLKCLEKANTLRQLRGIDLMAFALCFEFFGWREFKNRRQVGGLAGMCGTPYNSGDSVREQGIGKSGNKRVRTIAVELAWCWLMYQGDSKLSEWHREKYGGRGGQARKQGSVALARKLLVAWWNYLDRGVLPEGAVLKPGLEKS
jgi:transposase